MKPKLEFNEIDQQLIDELKAHTGFDETTILKLALRMLHRKELPQYLRKQKAKEQSEDPEKQCKDMGGEFFVDEQGRNACRIKHGGLEYVEIIR